MGYGISRVEQDQLSTSSVRRKDRWRANESDQKNRIKSPSKSPKKKIFLKRDTILKRLDNDFFLSLIKNEVGKMKTKQTNSEDQVKRYLT